ncbi:MAG: hydrogenase expression/formation protein HypE [Lachnospiraceae bacterium]|nr:hydrogenase expression/formation protein HypE [Lachnospiraceae bacterium]
MENRIDKTHGAGGVSTSQLIEEVFREAFSNKYLNELADSAVVPGASDLALTTDSFVVRPVVYPGGDIGRLAVCGTVNDLLMSGAKPAYLTAGYILEEGLEVDTLKKIVTSMAETAKEANVRIVTGDTKVVEAADPGNPGLMINTSGVGFISGKLRISPRYIKPKDAVILSGTLGDHHAAILGSRLSVKNNILSDNAPLTDMVSRLKESGIKIKAMRDVTRGGLATILNEFSEASGTHIYIEETALPVSQDVAGFSRLLGLDPLYMGNEGKCVIILPSDEAQQALDIIKGSRYGENAAIIGEVREVKSDPENTEKPGVLIHTSIGGIRTAGALVGEGLPRIC